MSLAAKQVSIHAPVWGATVNPLVGLNSLCFNPRTRVGCDITPLHDRSTEEFQSTHPCGVRLVYSVKYLGDIGFNPRTRVGCDHMPKFQPIRLPFQSTHPCGVRQKGYQAVKQIYKVSIHAPVWGATLNIRQGINTIVFQSTHPCGVRRQFIKRLM